MKPEQGVSLLFVASFLVGISLPGLAMLVPREARVDTGEKRALAGFPRLSETSLTEFPREVDAYIRDHFGFRDLLIRWNNRFKVQVLRTSPVRKAIVGRDGWLFYAAYGDGADIRDHLGRLPLTPAEIEARRNSIEERAAFFAEHGITYLFVVVPNKQTIHPERTGLQRARRPVTRLDQVAWNWGAPPIPFLDLRETLLSGPPGRELYYKTDSHWNLHGGFLGFQAILRRLAAMRADIPIVGDDYVRLPDRPAPGGDVAALLAMTDVLQDVGQDIEWQDEAVSPLRIVLVGDSFAESLHPFFESRFAYINSVPDAVGGRFDADAVLAQRPDIVIEAHVERYLVSW